MPKLPNAVLPWSPTLKLNASEVKSKADWLVKYLARTCNEAGHADLIIMPDQSRRQGSVVITKVVDIPDKKG